MRNSTETVLASLNTHGGRRADGRPYDLEAACRQLKADVIVLQEVWRPRAGPDPVTKIAAALGAEPLWDDLMREADLRSFGIADDIPTVIAGDLNMPGPLTGLAAGYAQAVSGRTYPAHRPLVQLDHILTSRRVAGCGGAVLPPAGSDHLPVRARLRLR